MKKRYSRSLIVVLVVVLTSCYINGDINFDKIPPCHAGNCEIITQERFLPPFTAVNHNFVGNVSISQGTEFKVIIHGEYFLVNNTRLVVSNGQLFIEFIENYRNLSDHLTTEVTIIAPEIDGITLGGVGNIITLNNLVAKNLEINLSGVGDVNAHIEAPEVLSRHSGVGNITLAGAVDTSEILFSGVGTFNAFDLVSNICEISLTSVGTCNVFAQEELIVTITSVGSVYYKGDPRVTSHISELGKLVKIE